MKNIVAITGLGALTPIGNNVKDYWCNLLAGVSGANKITRFDASSFKTHFACELKGYDPLNYFEKKEYRKLDRYSQYALIAATEAFEDSGIKTENLDLNRCGVIWASGIGGHETFELELEEYFKQPETPRFNPFFIPKILADSAAGLIAIKYGLRGVNFSPVSACASATNAIIEGFNYITWGKADMVVVGGSEAPITRASLGGFNAMKALSTSNDNFLTASKPFDKDRNGFVMGEGAGALVLERYDHAIKRGAKIYGKVMGGGLSADAFHITNTHPEGLGAQLAMNQAIEEAQIAKEDIGYVNVHATSTPPGDLSEIKALEAVFGQSPSHLQISATKSMTGHLLGAAGAIEGVALALAIYHGMIPPTINSQNIDDEISSNLNLTLGKAQSKQVNFALSNTFGFGGHNACIIIGK